MDRERAPDSAAPLEEANALVNLLSLTVNLEILSIVGRQLEIAKHHLSVLEQSRELKARELELRRVQLGNDLHFYETALEKLDRILDT